MKGGGDDRHIVTVAGSRAGKSSTVLIPNLMSYPGSIIVIDPKGELARATAKHRLEKLNNIVAVLDPYGTSGWKTTSYDPLSELDAFAETFIDDVSLVADALIIDAEKDLHWTDSAKSLIRGLILFMFAAGGETTLPRLRKILLGAEGQLSLPETAIDDPDAYLFMRMALMDDFDGLLALTGRSFMEKSPKELGSILSTAREQLAFLDSQPLARVLQPSPLRLRTVKETPTTIYLCLPAGRLATHFRWMRLIITLGLIELERDLTTPPYPVLFILEEFAALQRMRPIERAAGFFAGFGVRLWTVLQDFSQLKTHYPNSWETFLGNAGVIQAFGNVDLTTTKYLSDLIGQTVIREEQRNFAASASRGQGDTGTRYNLRSVPLLAPAEITMHFARGTGRQLVLVPGKPPIYMERLKIG